MTDKFTEPKPRKLIKLWQAYLWYYEVTEMRKKHNLRIQAIQRGVSNMDDAFELQVMEKLGLDEKKKELAKLMIGEGTHCSAWDWVTGIKGLKSGTLAAQLLAQIDDISQFDTIASLWRFCGYGLFFYWFDGNVRKVPLAGWKPVGEGFPRPLQWTITSEDMKGVTFPYPLDDNGDLIIPDHKEEKIVPKIKYVIPKSGWELKRVIDARLAGYHAPFNGKLKGILFNIADSFVKQQTPYYVDIYYSQKERQKELHPEKVKCVSKNGKTFYKYSPAHLHARARRKMIKVFLKNLWLEWREAEGLGLGEEYQSEFTNVI